jgi:hypothetical protein
MKGPIDGMMAISSITGRPDPTVSPTEKIMIARQEGGDWEIIPIHSIVIQGKRWDAFNRRWSDYDFTPEQIEENQSKR